MPDTDPILAALDHAAGDIAEARALVVDLDEGTAPPEPLPEGVDLDVLFEAPPLTQGQAAQLSAVVVNIGTDDVPAGTIVGVGFYLDDDTKEVAWASTDAGLPAGAEVTLSTFDAPWHSPPWVPATHGDHTLTAFVDDLDRVPEFDEDNNRERASVTIAEPTTPPPVEGAPLFAADSLWNTPKPQHAFAAGADDRLRSLSYGMNAGAYGHPITRSTAADPVHHIATPESWGWPAQDAMPVNMRDDAAPASGTDGHLCLLNADGRSVDMWQLHPTGSRSWRCAAYALHNWQTGTGWGSTSPWQSAGVTAAGAPTAAGTITADDLAGGIAHALCMAFSYNDQGGQGTCWTPQLWPAISNDVGGGPGPLAEGALLLATGPAPDGLNGAESSLWDALVTYGAYVIDKLDGQPMFYAESPEVGGAFRGDRLTAIGRQLRMAVTW
jgi:hypothetical protein